MRPEDTENFPPVGKPQGACKAIGFEMRRPANNKAVFVSVLCEDELGRPFHFTAASFCFELKPGHVGN